MTILDLSKWQGNIAASTFAGMSDVSRVILKAGGSNVGTYTDSVYVGNATAARAAGKPLGHYWFNGAGNPADDARYFVSHLAAYQPGDWLVIDTESYGPTMWNPAQVLEFAQTVKALTGVTPTVYMSASVTHEQNWSDVVAFGCPLWVAGYMAAAPSVGYWPSWAAWQFTSSGRVPGINGAVDLSHEGTAKTAVTPATPPVQEGTVMRLIRNNTQGDKNYGSTVAVAVESGFWWHCPNEGYVTLFAKRYGIQVEEIAASEWGFWETLAAQSAAQVAAQVWAAGLTGSDGVHKASDRLVGTELKAGTATAAAPTLPASFVDDVATEVVNQALASLSALIKKAA